eukprot:SAG11_NODE_18500_length_489_cov_0.930769_1_plen_70_part_01
MIGIVRSDLHSRVTVRAAQVKLGVLSHLGGIWAGNNADNEGHVCAEAHNFTRVSVPNLASFWLCIKAIWQ